MGMFVDRYFKIACSFTNVNLITSTRAYIYYVQWMNVFVFEFEDRNSLQTQRQKHSSIAHNIYRHVYL